MWSQNDEEKLIRDYFGDFVGVCLDLGANDGKLFSNTLACIQRGWSGLMVEASPSVIPALYETHKAAIAEGRVQVIPHAVAHQSGELVLQESGTHLGKGDKALLSTLIEKEADRWKTSGTTYTQQQVKALTWAEILEQSKWKTFDLISIDIEAMDFWVLTQMDLTALKCSLLIVEDNDGHEEHFVDYCREHGLKKWTRNAENILLRR